MKRYKLVKEYPGSPDKGTIVYSPHRERSFNDFPYKMKNTKNVKNYLFFDSVYIENFPEFWKKLK